MKNRAIQAPPRWQLSSRFTTSRHERRESWMFKGNSECLNNPATRDDVPNLNAGS
jgi:hypothetical protein